MAKGQVFKNHTLKEYEEKYGKKTKLIRFTKEEVNSFDSSNEKNRTNPNSKNEYKEFLLANRSWWLIGNTYYEVPIKVKGAHKCNCFGWVKHINKKAAIITTCAVLVAAGGGIGGYYIYKNIQDNKTILQKLGGKEIDKTAASEITNKYELAVAERVNYSVNFKKLELKNATLYIEKEEGKISEYSFDVNRNGLSLNGNLTFRDILRIQGVIDTGNDSTNVVSPEIYNALNDSQFITTKMTFTTIPTLLFHQGYGYVIDDLAKLITEGTKEGKAEFKYLNCNNELGIYFKINDLSNYIKEELEQESLFKSGTLEVGVRLGSAGFVDRVLFNLNGSLKTREENPEAVLVGDINANFDISLNRKLADFVDINYYVNGLTYEEYKKKGGKLEIPKQYIVDPLYLAEEGEEHSIETTQMVGISDRKYIAKITTPYDESSQEGVDISECNFYIDGRIADEHAPLLYACCKFDYEKNEDNKKIYKASIDKDIMSKNHTYAISLTTDETL